MAPFYQWLSTGVANSEIPKTTTRTDGNMPSKLNKHDITPGNIKDRFVGIVVGDRRRRSSAMPANWANVSRLFILI